MAVFSPDETAFLEAVSELVYGNPFLPARIAAEKAALGPAFVPLQEVWTAQPRHDDENVNVQRLAARTEQAAAVFQQRFRAGRTPPTGYELQLYQDLITYVVYYRHQANFLDLMQRTDDGSETGCAAPFFDRFIADMAELCDVPGLGRAAEPADLVHLFACFYQVRRAFWRIFRFLIGGSMATARLRAAVWQSVFTHDAHRYRRCLYGRMRDIPLLVTGPSGTGKELVARAVALSSYIPFAAASRRFAARPADQFSPLNLSALSPALIESELFGHRRGAFTGASGDHVGWLEQVGPHGMVFLDEIGDIQPGIQVKLLRVLETRTFYRLGETAPRGFAGKFAAATSRDLDHEIAEARFRQDLYYRLCADRIRTPSLQEQIADDPSQLSVLVEYLARRLVEEEEVDALTNEVMAWIERRLGPDYPWPGNVRELDQCVRNILVRSEYYPGRRPASDGFEDAFRAGKLSADEVLSRYCTQVYALTGNYQETARRLGLDHRTVKARIDERLLTRLRSAREHPEQP
ncbi:MAG: sigma-54-dependent Fis family transcriptional regulator [Lentisphaeria bacterium]|nr:sigma-54-dependent Fis family transcriptional regulator [Lentisphaeria bacterium]